jgi:hypothetical protein
VDNVPVAQTALLVCARAAAAAVYMVKVQGARHATRVVCAPHVLMVSSWRPKNVVKQLALARLVVLLVARHLVVFVKHAAQLITFAMGHACLWNPAGLRVQRITNVKVDHVVVAIAVTWTDYAQAVLTATSVASVNNAIQDTHFVDILIKVRASVSSVLVI